MEVILVKLYELIVYIIIPFVIILGILVLVHEVGHFITAKLSGIKVNEFAMGLGPALLKRKIGETEFSLRAFPLGGYVKVLGDPSEMEDPDTEVPPEEMHRALFKKPVWKRLIFYTAGSFMNVALAFAAAPFIYIIGIEKAYYNELAPCDIGYIEPGSPADTAGLFPGDRVISINGKPVPDFRELRMTEALNPREVLTYEVRRGDTVLVRDIELEVSERERIGYSGILEPMYGATIGTVIEGYPADLAGIKPGDRVLSINGEPVSYWHELTTLIKASGGDTISMVVLRDGHELAFEIEPRYYEEYDKFMVGIGYFEHTVLVRHGLIESVEAGLDELTEMTVLILVTVKKLFSFKLSIKAVTGPAGIAGITGAAAHQGLSHLVWLLALISINLAIINMLPIPPFDGAHFFITGIEGIIRREMKMKWKELIFRVGFSLLIALMVLITVNDFIRFKDPIVQWFREIARGLGIN